jgi:hypothetical protein
VQIATPRSTNVDAGSLDLALNVLGLFVPPPEAYRLHQDFKRDFIAILPREGGTIAAGEVREWIQREWAQLELGT